MEIVALLIFGTLALAHLAPIIGQAVRIYNYRPDTLNGQPKVSVIACAHNEENNLQRLIPLLLDQDYDNYELIVVLDRCSDKSEEVLSQFSDRRLTQLKINEVPTDFHPKKLAITQAIDHCSGEWVLLTDADCRPSNAWVREMSRGMQTEKDVVLGLSPYIKKTGLLHLLVQYETFMTAFRFVGLALKGQPYMGLGRNLAYRKSAFLEIGGFGPVANVIGGDDDLLVQRLVKRDNFTVILSKNAMVDSIPSPSWPAYFKQKTRHFSVGKRYPGWIKRLEAFRWTWHWLFWVFFVISLLFSPFFAMVIFLITFIVKAISINIVADRLEKRFNHLWLPFVDLLYVVILPLLSLRSLLVKKITWN